MTGYKYKHEDGKRHITATRFEDGTTQFQFSRLINRETREIFRAGIRVSDGGFLAMMELWEKGRGRENGTKKGGIR